MILAMARESLVLVLAVAFSVGIMGWIIWSERPLPTVASAARPPAPEGESIPVPELDEGRIEELMSLVEADASDVESRVALANAYFEGQSFEEAIRWFEEALSLSPADVDSSTKLGVSFYFSDLPERAVEQFDRSLEIAPTDPQTLLNLGIVRAFGLQDLDGAVDAWERVLEVAPGGAQARAAREALSQFQASHDLSGSSTEAAEPAVP